jgi:hypothetical protein
MRRSERGVVGVGEVKFVELATFECSAARTGACDIILELPHPSVREANHKTI